VPDPRLQPYHLPDPHRYAIEQERKRHHDALYRFGEYAFFVLMWRVRDFEEGLVERCSLCYRSSGEVAEAYGQSVRHRCASCYGTTFEGGYKARIVRPTIWNDTGQTHRDSPRGEVITETATSIEAPADFLLRTGDYIFRGDGTRWQMASMGKTEISVGFETRTDQRNAVAFNFGRANLEDRSSVVYDIPPTEEALIAALDLRDPRHPQDFTSVEEIRGPLWPR
jgi:hypothetical protein